MADTPGIKVCLTPALIPYYRLEQTIVVVIDVLRATTSICVAFGNGVEHIVPVETIEECRSYLSKGYLCAAERDGSVVEGFQFGNSPYSFMGPTLKGRRIALTTTNGTHAIHAASGALQVTIGSFANLTVLRDYLLQRRENVVMLCAGWKNTINLEDSLFAGAMVAALGPHYTAADDSAVVARSLYEAAVRDKRFYLKSSTHYRRLIELHLQRDVKYCLRQDTQPVLPVFTDGKLVDLLAHSAQ